jgi:hypothetical protein
MKIKRLFDPALTQPDPAFAQQLRRTVPGMAHFAGTGPVGERKVSPARRGHSSWSAHRPLLKVY